MQIFPSDKFAFETTKTMKNETVAHQNGRGKRKTMTNRRYPVYEIKLSLLGVTQEEMETLVGFFASVKGEPFLFRDFEDYAQYGVLIGAGDGENRDFQLVRSWGGLFFEPVEDIVPGTLTAYVGDNRASASILPGGVARLALPPPLGAQIRADFEYYWRVAVDDDISWQSVFFNLYKLDNLKLVTV
jgi:uncharacterized protein (TIGR02217 family)